MEKQDNPIPTSNAQRGNGDNSRDPKTGDTEWRG